jgi:hypothetical protein
MRLDVAGGGGDRQSVTCVTCQLPSLSQRATFTPGDPNVAKYKHGPMSALTVSGASTLRRMPIPAPSSGVPIRRIATQLAFGPESGRNVVIRGMPD